MFKKVLCKCAAFLPALAWRSHASFCACTYCFMVDPYLIPQRPPTDIRWSPDGAPNLNSLSQWPLQDLQSNPFSAHVAHLLCNGKSLVLCISPYVFRLVLSLFLIYMSHMALTKFTQLANGRWENSTWNCAVIRPIGILSRSWRTDLCLQMSTVQWCRKVKNIGGASGNRWG